MNGLASAIQAEHIKLRRTLARGLSIIAPVTAASISLFLLGGIEQLAAARQVDAWQAYIDAALRIWASLLLPVCVTLQAVLVAQLEHGNAQWKHLFALPVPRHRIYIAKLVVLLVLLLAASALACALVLAIAWQVGLATGPAALAEAAIHATTTTAAISAAALPMLALQFLVAMRTSSFTAAIAFGTIATMVAAIATSTMGDFAYFFPWSMATMVVGAEPQTVSVIVSGGFVASFLASLIGERVFSTRNIA